jgi:hypothetical protein
MCDCALCAVAAASDDGCEDYRHRRSREDEAAKAAKAAKATTPQGGGTASSVRVMPSDMPPEERQAKGTKTQRRAEQQAQGTRLWCHLLLHEHYSKFDILPVLTGEGGLPRQWGCHTILVCRRSNYAQNYYGKSRKEPNHLMMVAVVGALAESSQVECRLHDADGANDPSFLNAVYVTLVKLKEIWEPFAGERPGTHNEQPFTFGEMSKDAESVLAELLPPLIPIGEEDFSVATCHRTTLSHAGVKSVEEPQ